MLIILSPSKDMGDTPGNHPSGLPFSYPGFLRLSEELHRELSRFDPIQLATLMSTNRQLAEKTFLWFQNWLSRPTEKDGTIALLSYTGEAFRGLQARTFNNDQIFRANDVLRILSGLYGLLKPLDLIMPYRLEMGINHLFGEKKNLFRFWSESLTHAVEEDLVQSPGEQVLINLASKEYSSFIDIKKLKFPVVSPEFREERYGEQKIVTVYTKRARGMMARFIIENQIERTEELKAFDYDGYHFDNKRSSDNRLIFVRTGR